MTRTKNGPTPTADEPEAGSFVPARWRANFLDDSCLSYAEACENSDDFFHAAMLVTKSLSFNACQGRHAAWEIATHAKNCYATMQMNLKKLGA